MKKAAYEGANTYHMQQNFTHLLANVGCLKARNTGFGDCMVLWSTVVRIMHSSKPHRFRHKFSQKGAAAVTGNAFGRE